MIDAIEIDTAPAPLPTINLTFRPVLTPRGQAVVALIRRNWLRELDREARLMALDDLLGPMGLDGADYLAVAELLDIHQED